MQVEPLDLCYTQPNLYKLCNRIICVKKDQNCPCKAYSEFGCWQGNCIPIRLQCDGVKHCLNGEDEEQCLVENKTEQMDSQTHALTESFKTDNSAVKDKLSIPVVVTIASICVFASVLVVILLYMFISSRRKNNTSRESQSATEPLQKSYITLDMEHTPLPRQPNKITDSSRKCERIYYQPICEQTHNLPISERTHNLPLPDQTHYQPVDSECNDNDFQINFHKKRYKRNYLETEENVHNKYRRNLAINPGVEIYNTDPSSECRVSGLGRYTFKPRLKYMTSKPYHEIEEKDRDKLYVINSYKHCSGKSILPSTLTFDNDPEKFSNKFATDLLCSSTPRQPMKHFIKNSVSGSLESITAQCDVAVT